MKLIITLKDPDGVFDAFDDAAKEMVSQEQANDDYEHDLERARQSLVDATHDFIEYQEYVYLEFDTETKTMRVLPRNEW